MAVQGLPPAAAAVSPEDDVPSLEELLELDFEELIEMDVPVITSASKFDQKALTAPSSVTVVTSEQIRLFGYRTLGEILDGVCGFYTSNDRNYDYLGVRGLSRPGDYNTRVLILLNGVRMNEPVYSSSSIGGDFVLDVELIDRIEVIRGPSSSLYGTNAFFAIVNVFTKTGSQLGSAEIAGEAASYDTYRGRLSYGNAFANGLDFMVSATALDSTGHDRLYYPEFDDPATNHGVAENADAEDYQNFFASLKYKDFSLNAVYGARNKTVPTAPWGTVFNDPRLFTDDRHTYINLGYGVDLGSDSRLDATVYYNKYDYDGVYPFDWAEEPGDDPYIVLNTDKARSTWVGGEVQFSTELGKRNHLIVGAMYEDQLQIDQSNYDEEVYLDDRRDGQLWAIFAQDEITLSDKWLLNIGLRHDDYSTFGGTTNPRLAVIFSPVERTAIKLLYGTAFRAPSAYELYYHDGYYTQKPAPDLEPETIETLELVWESFIGRNYLLRATLFSNEIDNLVSFIIDPEDELLQFTNAGQVESKGAEIEFAAEWRSGTKGRLSYSYQNAEDKITGERLSNSPVSLAKFHLIQPLIKDKFMGTAEVHYSSSRLGVFGGSTGSFVDANLNLYLKAVVPGLDISACVFNLFGEEYYDPGSEEHTQEFIAQNGTTYRVRLIYRF